MSETFRFDFAALLLEQFAASKGWHSPVISRVETQVLYPESSILTDMRITLEDGRVILCVNSIEVSAKPEQVFERQELLCGCLDLPIDGVAYIGAYTCDSLEPFILLDSRFITRNGQHFLWSDIYPLLKGNSNPLVISVCTGFEKMGLASSPPDADTLARFSELESEWIEVPPAVHNRGAIINFEDVTIDPVNHWVWRNGQKIELTAKEYRLLLFMVQNANQVLSREMINKNAFDNTLDNNSNIIDVYFSYLRNKIEKGFTDKLIYTVRGKGYILKGVERDSSKVYSKHRSTTQVQSAKTQIVEPDITSIFSQQFQNRNTYSDCTSVSETIDDIKI